MTTPRSHIFAHDRMASTSSSVRYTNTPARSVPGTGGTNGALPVASTSWS